MLFSCLYLWRFAASAHFILEMAPAPLGTAAPACGTSVVQRRRRGGRGGGCSWSVWTGVEVLLFVWCDVAVWIYNSEDDIPAGLDTPEGFRSRCSSLDVCNVLCVLWKR